MSLQNAQGVNQGLLSGGNAQQAVMNSAAENSMEIDSQMSEATQELPISQTMVPPIQTRPSVGVVA